jgi:hypothetical protein
MLTAASTSIAQKETAPKNPPAAVLNAFDSKYQGATKTKWEYEGDDLWEVEYELEQQKLEAEFSAAGAWLLTEKDIDLAEVPANISDYLGKTYPDFRFVEAEWIQKPEGEFYEIEIKHAKKSHSFTFDKDGKLMPAEKEEAEAEESPKKKKK